MNFKISELIHSEKAILFNINNMPDINSLDNMLDLIVYCLQPIRDKLKKPMIITSGYRCGRLNDVVNGAKNSQHLYGQAVDFVVQGMTPKQIVEFIKNSGVEFDQLIEEHTWVHISFKKNNNRKESLIYKNGKYIKL